MRAGSLRAKLTLWFVLVFFAIQTVLVLGLVLFRREMIRRTRDETLIEAAEAMVDNVLSAEAAWRAEELEPLVPRGAGFVFFGIRDPEGAFLARWNLLPNAEVPFSAWEVVPSGPVGAVVTQLGPDTAAELTGARDQLLLVTVPFRQNERPYFFQAAVPDRELETLLGPFLDLVVLGMPAGLFAAVVAAWWIAGRAVKPIDRLAAAARRVSPANLEERFGSAGSDQEISRLEAELDSALERLEAGYAAQDAFISNVSHELKTPVAVLLTEAQVLRSSERSAEEQREFVERVERSMRRLAKLVESFLMLARADLSGPQPTQPVSLHDLTLDAVQGVGPLAELGQVKVVPRLAEDGEEPAVEGDEGLLRTALENLLRNGVQHSPRGGSVEVEVTRSGEHARIEVRDRGPGVPEHERDRIFERFERLTSSLAGAPEGSGLGLAIARHVARLHHGTVTVEARSGGGAQFVLLLPLARSA